MSERHRWGDPISIFENTPSGCEETERVCILCGIVKITVHPRDRSEFPWRAWRTREGTRMEVDHTPPCRPVGNIETVAAA